MAVQIRVPHHAHGCDSAGQLRVQLPIAEEAYQVLILRSKRLTG